ncbi:hypothetical protein ACLB2K_061425 [Fragaria x ananassa]
MFWIAFGPASVAFLAHEGWRSLAARDLDLSKDSDTPRDSMSSRDPYFQLVWDSTVHDEVELEMDDSALGIGSLGVRVRVRHYSEMMRGGEQDLSKILMIQALPSLPPRDGPVPPQQPFSFKAQARAKKPSRNGKEKSGKNTRPSRSKGSSKTQEQCTFLLRQGISQNGLKSSRYMSSKPFVGGLSISTDDNSLKEAFSGFGVVTDGRCSLGLLPLNLRFVTHGYISQAAKLETHGAPACPSFSLEELKEATKDFDFSTDYSGWFVKYHVDLHPLCTAFPDLPYGEFVVLFLDGDENEEDGSLSLLLHSPGNVISCNLKSKTFKSFELTTDERLLVDHRNFMYKESLACV